MDQHELEIQIRPDGRVQVHVKGAKGPVCMDYVEFFQKLVGKVERTERTPEYYEQPLEAQTLAHDVQRVRERGR